jgi:zinc protease
MMAIARRPLLAFAWLLLALMAAAPSARAAAERVVSPGGIEAWLIEDHGNPLISIAIGFHGGAASDPAGKEGLSRLVAGLLDEGAGDMTGAAFQKEIADRGIDFAFDASQDDFQGEMRMLTRDRDRAMQLLGLALAAPRFDADAVKRIKTQMLAMIASAADDPETIAGEAWMRLVLGRHPYARPTLGTPASMAAIAPADLHRFAGARFARDRLKIAVVGDIDAATLAPLLDSTFGRLPAHGEAAAVPAAMPAATGGVAVIERDLAQTIVNFGHAGIARSDPDYYAAVLLDDIMAGGNFRSRLEESLREKRGLVYSVETSLEPFDHVALVAGSLGTKNATAGAAIALVQAEWQRMHEAGPDAAELADAKTHINGAFPLRFTSTGGAASTLLGIQLEDLPIDYLEQRAGLFDKVTLEDAKRVAKRLYDPAALRFLALGRPQGVTATLASPAAGE